MSSRAAYTLMEIMVVIALIGFGCGLVFDLVVRGAHRFEEASAVAENRMHAALALESMAQDIRSAGAVRAGDGRLELTETKGSKIVWDVRDGRLARRADTVRMFAFQVDGMRIVRADARLVEVAVMVPATGASSAMVWHVAAGPREGARR